MIPSKGRPGCAAWRFLVEAGLEPVLFVEPQDMDAYAKACPGATLEVLAGSSRGIVYVRNAMLEWARERGLQRYWQIDDNIQALGKVANRKVVKCDPTEALVCAESVLSSNPRLALVGMAHREFAWSTKVAFSYKYIPVSCVLTRTDTGLSYDPAAEMKEDVDFALQHWRKGWPTCSVLAYAMAKPKMGGGSRGGLAERYANREDESGALAVHAKYPDWTELDRNSLGHIDVKVMWDRVMRRPVGRVRSKTGVQEVT